MQTAALQIKKPLLALHNTANGLAAIFYKRAKRAVRD
jgi:hypothetical protein